MDAYRRFSLQFIEKELSGTYFQEARQVNLKTDELTQLLELVGQEALEHID